MFCPTKYKTPHDAAAAIHHYRVINQSATLENPASDTHELLTYFEQAYKGIITLSIIERVTVNVIPQHDLLQWPYNLAQTKSHH